MSTTVQRKLTTILAADAEGYSRAMDTDEVSTLTALRAARSVFAKFIERHHGRIVNTAGDGLIAEFPSVVETVQCAIEVQNELGSASTSDANPLRFRIGIHLGDVMIDGTDLLGEGVNLAARLESMAEPGGVLISQQVYDQVQHKLSVGFEYLGEKRPKNFAEDVPVYRLSIGDQQPRSPHRARHVRTEQGNQAETDTPQHTPPQHTPPQHTLRHVKMLGIIWIALLAIDLLTGSPFWAHWPGLALGLLVALQAAPSLVRGWFNVHYVRIAIVVIALVLVNLFSWTGYPWALWPAGAIVVIALILRQTKLPD